MLDIFILCAYWKSRVVYKYAMRGASGRYAFCSLNSQNRSINMSATRHLLKFAQIRGTPLDGVMTSTSRACAFKKWRYQNLHALIVVYTKFYEICITLRNRRQRYGTTLNEKTYSLRIKDPQHRPTLSKTGQNASKCQCKMLVKRTLEQYYGVQN